MKTWLIDINQIELEWMFHRRVMVMVTLLQGHDH